MILTHTPTQTTVEARDRLPAALVRLWTRDEQIAVSTDHPLADRPSRHPEHCFRLYDPGGVVLEVVVAREQAGPSAFTHTPDQVRVSVRIGKAWHGNSLLRGFCIIEAMLQTFLAPTAPPRMVTVGGDGAIEAIYPFQAIMANDTND